MGLLYLYLHLYNRPIAKGVNPNSVNMFDSTVLLTQAKFPAAFLKGTDPKHIDERYLVCRLFHVGALIGS